MSEQEALQQIRQAAKRRARQLNLCNKRMSSLPPQIRNLKNLQFLYLSGNSLDSLPPEIGQLVNLRRLDVDRNRLSSLPPDIGELSKLRVLYLYGNRLSSLPPEIGRLSRLERLELAGNQLTSVPSEIAGLAQLRILDLSRLRPRWRSRMTGPLGQSHLFNLGGNELTSLPREIGQLTSLEALALGGNKLTALPPEIAQLTNLEKLDLLYNQLGAIPPEIGQLTNLRYLNLGGNQLGAIPPEIGQLSNLEILDVDENPLEFPPPEIVKQGTKAILAFLREQGEASEEIWVSKLLFVGEGGVGKTCLLKALLGEEFDEEEDSTRGIEVERLRLPHPQRTDVTMQLNAWDFGGQQIYHATHQFFLSERSLYLLVWNARVGYEQSKLEYWLDNIHARAPESPILLVATHIDQRAPDLPYTDLKRKFPQIAGRWSVSNKDDTGIAEIKTAIAAQAANLPLMGERWPATWLDAGLAILSRTENYISPSRFKKTVLEHRVKENDIPTLSRYLHDLGDILYYVDDPELNGTVILNPEWVTRHVFQVLDSEEVTEHVGVFTRDYMNEIWRGEDPNIRELFLRLMEKFDLSYRTLIEPDKSIVVEHLSFEPPGYQDLWDSKSGASEIQMKFYLDTVLPPGIPTWFIARSHRFTTYNHWRLGALFADDTDHTHVGLVQAFPHDRYLQLTVRGFFPQNFFTLLKDGLELTLARFPGIKVTRKIPCPGHDGEPCSHEFDYEQLRRRIEAVPDDRYVECPETFKKVDTFNLLFGLAPSRTDEVISVIRSEFARKDEIDRARHQEMVELVQRNFLLTYNALQQLEESHCPRLFTLYPKGRSVAKRKLIGETMVLQLYCEAPGECHPTDESGRYEFKLSAKWLNAIAPYVRGMVKIMKVAAPLAAPAAGGIFSLELSKQVENQFKLTEELVKQLPDIEDSEELGFRRGMLEQRAEGADLRALRELLDKLDRAHKWGGLKKVLTPEGHYLWLCDHHAQEYRR